MTNYIYTIDGANDGVIVRSTQSSDGKSFSKPVPITINGKVAADVYDPDALRLANGQYLLFYGLAPPNTPTQEYTAVSTDGINFTDVRLAFFTPPPQILSDPTNVRLSDGSFLMGISHGLGAPNEPAPGPFFLELFKSTDGRTYTKTGVTLPDVFAPDFLALPNGDVRVFYGVDRTGVMSRSSHDGGQTWTQETGLRLPYSAQTNFASFNPTVLQTAPGQWEMLVSYALDPSQRPVPGNTATLVATSTDALNFTVSQLEAFRTASVPDLVSDGVVAPVAVSGPSKNYTLSLTAGASSLSLQD